MKVWRLHVKGELREGPYRNDVNAPDLGHLLADHKTPWMHIDALADACEFDLATELSCAFNQCRSECWVFGWSTAEQMRRYVPDADDWDFILHHYEVAVLDVSDYYVMPDGQVMFNPTTARATGEPFYYAKEINE